MKRFPPPPTQVEPIDADSRPTKFDPQWLRWFTDIGARDLYYGVFYSLETQTPASSNTEQAVLMEGVQVKVNVNIPDQASKVRFTQSGLYRILCNLRLRNSVGSAQTVAVWLKLNGVPVSASAVKTVVGPSDTEYLILHHTLGIRAGEYLEVFWSASSTAVELVFDEADGDTPAVPAVVFEASQMDLWDNYKRP